MRPQQPSTQQLGRENEGGKHDVSGICGKSLVTSITQIHRYVWEQCVDVDGANTSGWRHLHKTAEPVTCLPTLIPVTSHICIS